MSLTMFADAVRFSTERQVGAIFDHVKVTVEPNEGRYCHSLRINVYVTHRGMSLATADTIPMELAVDPKFYDNFLREGLSRWVSERLMTVLMKQAIGD